MFYQDSSDSVKTSPSWTEDRLAWLALTWFDGFGSRTLAKLRERYGPEGQAALQIGQEELLEMGHTQKIIERFFEFRQTTDPNALAATLERQAISFVLLGDETYPALLAQISDPPHALFVRGPSLKKMRDCLAVVGTRNMTPYGQSVTRMLCRDLVLSGLGVVSGLALGIDAASHEAALNNSGYTLAVLGSGIDDEHIYPRNNYGLAQNILEHGGHLISELPPGSEAFKYHFPLRNRIIAGLCRATIVVEAAESSGSLLTAHLALQYNRDVFAVPGPILHGQSSGTNKLLKLGAIPCTGIDDILEALQMSKPTLPDVSEALPEPLSTAEQAVADLLTHPRHIDELKRTLQMEITSLMRLLTDMELKGLIEEQAGNTYTLTRRNSHKIP